MPKQWSYSKSWCAEKQINIGTYYRWQKKVWEAGTQKMAVRPMGADSINFVEYQPLPKERESAAAVVLQMGHIRLEIQNGADEQTIESTIKAIGRLC